MAAVHVVSELMAEHAPELGVVPKAIVCVCAHTEQDRFTGVDIETEQTWVLVRGELCEKSDGEFVCAHDMDDRGIVCELVEDRPGLNWVRKIREGLDTVEAELSLRG